MLLWIKLITALVFIVTSGAVFRKQFAERKLVNSLAALVALISGVYLLVEVKSDVSARLQLEDKGGGQQSTSLVLSTHGIGNVRFGYSVEDSNSAVGQKLFSREEWKGGTKSCYHGEYKNYPGMIFMIVDNIIVRADVEVGVKNVLNISVGDRLEKVQAMHPSLERRPDGAVPGEEYVIFRSQRPGYALVLVVYEGIVSTIRAGTEPAVYFVEQCL